MRKVAVFTEGIGELIFVRELLFLRIPSDKLSFECCSLLGDNFKYEPYEYSPPNPEVYFLLVSIGNDQRVMTVVKDRQEGLVNAGYEKVIALRDMYCEEYRDRSATISDTVTDAFIEAHQSVVDSMSNSDRCF